MANQPKNYINQRFGRLLVLERMENSKSGRSRWRCKCDCGNEITTLQGSLSNGATFSCGCYRRDRRNDYLRKQEIELLSRPPYKRVFNMLYQKAKRRHIECDITYEQLLEFINIKECYYCGGEIKWQPKHTKTEVPSRTNLDRIDSSKGYSKENCVVCCYRCNVIKNDMTQQEFYHHISLILKRKGML